MREIVHVVKDLPALERLWRQGLKHGALLIPVHPMPNNGEKVEVVLRPHFASSLVKLTGQVTQATPAITILQLDPFSADARDRLVDLGLVAAANAKAAPAQAPAAPSASAPAPSQEPAGSPPPAPAPVAEAPAAPEPAPVAATPTPAPAPAAKAFKPKPKAFKPKAFKPAAARPRPAAPAPAPTTGSIQTGPAPGAAPGDVSDRAIFAAPGPADTRTERLLGAATAHGDLAKFSWRDALLHFYRQRATGVLAIDAFREVRWAYLIDGKPVHYLGSTPHPGEYLAEALIQEGAVTQKQWTAALRVQRLTGMMAGQVLITQRKLTEQQLNAGLTRRAERITRNLLSANFGKFRFHPTEEIRPVFKNKPVEVLDLLWNSQMDVLKKAEDDALVQKAEKLYPLRVRILAARADLIDGLPMNTYEAHVAKELLPASWTLKELVALNEIEERALLRLLFALDAMGVVEFVDPDAESSKTKRAQRILYEGWKDLSRRDPFSALHAHWSSNVTEIEVGYTKLKKEFSAQRFGDAVDSRVQELLDRIHQLAESTYTSLKTKQGRVEARKGIVGTDQLMMAADLLDKQGEMALYKKDFPVAKALYEKVLELDPGGPEGREGRERAKKYLSMPEVKHASTAGVVLDDYARRMDAMIG